MQTSGEDISPVLVVHANWQARPLIQIFERLPLLKDRLTIVSLDDRVSVATALAELPSGTMSRVIMVWEQRLSWWKPSANNLPANLPLKAEWLRFPFLQLEAFWPLAGSDPRAVPEPPLYPNSRFAPIDRIAAEFANDPRDDDTVFADYLARSTSAVGNIEATLISDIQRLAAMDEQCDVQATPFFINHYRNQKLFHNRMAPAGQLYALFAEQLGLRLADRLGVDREAMIHSVRYITVGSPGIAHEQFPVHPEVSHRLGLDWCGENASYRQYKNDWNFRDYMVKYIRWADWAR